METSSNDVVTVMWLSIILIVVLYLCGLFQTCSCDIAVTTSMDIANTTVFANVSYKGTMLCQAISGLLSKAANGK